jgi:hypothetical protein
MIMSPTRAADKASHSDSDDDPPPAAGTPGLVERFCRANHIDVEAARQRLAVLGLAARDRLAAAVARDAERERRGWR